MSVDFDNLLIGIGRILSPGRRVRITGLLFFRGFFCPLYCAAMGFQSLTPGRCVDINIIHGIFAESAACMGLLSWPAVNPLKGDSD